jgi:hypothetical protein
MKLNYVFSSFKASVRITLVITNSLSNYSCMEDGRCRVMVSRPATYEVSRPQYKSAFHCRVHRSLPLYPKVSQMNSIGTIFHKDCPEFIPCLRTHFNIIFPYRRTLSAPIHLLTAGCPIRVLYPFLIVQYMSPYQSHSFSLDLLNNLTDKYTSWSVTLWKFTHPPVTSSPFCPNILFSSLFSDWFNGYSKALWQYLIQYTWVIWTFLFDVYLIHTAYRDFVFLISSRNLLLLNFVP